MCDSSADRQNRRCQHAVHICRHQDRQFTFHSDVTAQLHSRHTHCTGQHHPVRANTTGLIWTDFSLTVTLLDLINC